MILFYITAIKYHSFQNILQYKLQPGLNFVYVGQHKLDVSSGKLD